MYYDPFGGSQTTALSNIFNVPPSTNFLLLGVILSPLRMYKLMNIKFNAQAMVNTQEILSFIVIFIDCYNFATQFWGDPLLSVMVMSETLWDAATY